jgi:hypothetical protein
LSSTEIGRHLSTSAIDHQDHAGRLLTKLGAHATGAQLVIAAYETGLIRTR